MVVVVPEGFVVVVVVPAGFVVVVVPAGFVVVVVSSLGVTTYLLPPAVVPSGSVPQMSLSPA